MKRSPGARLRVNPIRSPTANSAVGVERNIGHLRKYLGQNAMQQGLHPACSSGLNRLNGLYIDVFYGLAEILPTIPPSANLKPTRRVMPKTDRGDKKDPLDEFGN